VGFARFMFQALVGYCLFFVIVQLIKYLYRFQTNKLVSEDEEDNKLGLVNVHNC